MAQYTQEEIRLAMREAARLGDREALEILKQELLQAGKDEESRMNMEEGRKQVVAGMTPMQRFGAGVGQGAQNVWMNVKDIASKVPGLSGIAPPQQEWDEFREASNPLLQTRAGKIGSFVGETGATSPIGLGSGVLAKQVGIKLGRAGLPRLARYAGGKLGQTIAAGAHEGAVLAGPDNRGAGYIGGGLAAGAFNLGGRALRNLYAGYVKPTRHAEYLMRAGVDDMTLGRMNPQSALGQLEEAATSFPGIGPMVAERRQIPVQNWQRLMVNRTVPVGESVKLRAQDTVDDMMSKTYPAFNKAWAKFKGYPVRPVVETDVLSQIAGAPVGYQGRRVMLGSGVQQMVRAAAPEVGLHPRSREVRDILMQFETFSRNIGAKKAAVGVRASGAQRWPGDPIMDSEDLIELGSKVRSARRDVSVGDPYFKGKRALWRKIENALDAVAERDMPNGAALRDLRSRYAEWHTLNRATVASAGRPGGFTPREALQSYRKGLSDVAKTTKASRGQKLATAARLTFEPTVPLTGARMFLTIPGGLMAPMLLSPGFAKSMAGRTRPQKALMGLERALTKPLGPRGRRIGSRAGQAFFAGLGANQVSQKDIQDEQARQAIRRARESVGY